MPAVLIAPGRGVSRELLRRDFPTALFPADRFSIWSPDKYEILRALFLNNFLVVADDFFSEPVCRYLYGDGIWVGELPKVIRIVGRPNATPDEYHPLVHWVLANPALRIDYNEIVLEA